MSPRLEKIKTQLDGREIGWMALPGSQQLFLKLRGDVFEALYEGTRGPGKTDTLLMDYLQEVGKGFGASWRGILFRQTYPQLQDVITKTLKWFPRIYPAAKYNRQSHIWTFPGGEELLLRQFNREDDYWNFHGHEYPWVGWEELCNWADPNGYKRMMSTCRSSDARVAKLIRYRATTNPYGPGHNWVKHRFRLPSSRHKIITDARDKDGNPEPWRIAIHGHIDENLVLAQSDPNYKQRIIASARNPAELKAWLEGSWDIVAGGMFDDVWEPSVHVVPAFNIPSSWKINRSFDWGSSKPFSVGWWAESDGADYLDASGRVRSSVRGDLFRIAEYYGWTGEPNEGLRYTAPQIAKEVIKREVLMGYHGRVKPGPADSSIYDVINGMCIADDMRLPVRLANGREYSGPTFERADKSAGSRKTGWEQMRRALKNALPNPNGAPREAPGLFIFDRCDQFLRTVPVLARSDKDPDDVNTDTEDHIADESRYRVHQIAQKASSGTAKGNH